MNGRRRGRWRNFLFWRHNSRLFRRRNCGTRRRRIYLVAQFSQRWIRRGWRPCRNWFPGQGFIEFFEPAANIVARVGWQTRKFESNDVAVVFQPHDDGFPVDTSRGVQRKRKRNFFGWFQRHHGAKRESVLGEIAHHPTVGGREFHVDKGQRTFADLGAAIGFDAHGPSNNENSNSRAGVLGEVLRKRAQKRTVGRGEFRVEHKRARRAPGRIRKEGKV